MTQVAISARQKQVAFTQDLVKEKVVIESKIQDFESILRSQGKIGMQTALIDKDGFPRGAIDVYAVKNARASLVPLYNDAKSKTSEIEAALILLHSIPADPVLDPAGPATAKELVSFAKCNGTCSA